MRKIKTIVLANPCTDIDPILFTDADGYLFPRAVESLRSLGIVGDVAISMSRSVPAGFQDIIRQWDIPCIFSDAALPQHRLAELAGADNADGYLLLTPYSYLLEKERLAEAVEIFASGAGGCIRYKGSSSSSCFCLCDKAAVDIIAEYAGFAITPFVFADYLRQSAGSDAVVELTPSEESAVRSILYKLLYYGDNGCLPKEYIGNYFSMTQHDDLFSAASYTDHLSAYFNIDDFDGFAEKAVRLFGDQRIDSIAAQVHLIKRMMPYFPDNKGAFLELGFGASPMASLLLLNVFDGGYAVEPYSMQSIGCDWVEFISNAIAIPNYIDLGRTKNCEDALRSLDIRESTVEDCGIPEGSVDFIFSRTVFEHIDDVPGVSWALFDLLSSKGCMYHIIDFRDHVDTSTIRFDFLKYDRETWTGFSDSSTNLWRVNDIMDLWTDMGFEVQVLERLSRTQQVKDIHPCWDAYAPDDLFCYHAILLATKP